MRLVATKPAATTVRDATRFPAIGWFTDRLAFTPSPQRFGATGGCQGGGGQPSVAPLPVDASEAELVDRDSLCTRFAAVCRRQCAVSLTGARCPVFSGTEVDQRDLFCRFHSLHRGGLPAAVPGRQCAAVFALG